jgi:beta-phosphoglucomutase-like phosphatase (HAD superfamily)
LAISAAIFDLDGTLVDNMRFHAEASAALFARLGHPVPPERFAVERAIALRFARTWSRCAACASCSRACVPPV